MPRASETAKKMIRNNAGEFVGLPKGAEKKNKISTRNQGEAWGKEDVKELKALIKENTPTRVIGLKLGRTVSSVQDKVAKEGLSLKPTNQSPYGRVSKSSSSKKH